VPHRSQVFMLVNRLVTGDKPRQSISSGPRATIRIGPHHRQARRRTADDLASARPRPYQATEPEPRSRPAPGFPRASRRRRRPNAQCAGPAQVPSDRFRPSSVLPACLRFGDKRVVLILPSAGSLSRSPRPVAQARVARPAGWSAAGRARWRASLRSALVIAISSAPAASVRDHVPRRPSPLQR
jgi:hypothetical protein